MVQGSRGQFLLGRHRGWRAPRKKRPRRRRHSRRLRSRSRRGHAPIARRHRRCLRSAGVANWSTLCCGLYVCVNSVNKRKWTLDAANVASFTRPRRSKSAVDAETHRRARRHGGGDGEVQLVREEIVTFERRTVGVVRVTRSCVARWRDACFFGFGANDATQRDATTQ